MTNRQEIVLKAFLVSLPPEKREALAAHLPPMRRKALSDCPDISLNLSDTPPNPFDEIHWSWFKDPLQNFDEKEQKLILRALKSRTQTQLSKAIDVSPTADFITPLGAAFFRRTLLKEVEVDVLPVSLLPPSPFNRLLEIEKKRLIQLIDFLSLYDLFCEIRQIVETKMLNSIYSCLSGEERKFLKVASHHKEPYPPVRFHLENWDGSKQMFRKMVHKTGLARLGSALSGAHPDLIWHLKHRLDRGRGRALEKLVLKKAMPGVAKWLAEQLKEFI